MSSKKKQEKVHNHTKKKTKNEKINILLVKILKPWFSNFLSPLFEKNLREMISPSYVARPPNGKPSPHRVAHPHPMRWGSFRTLFFPSFHLKFQGCLTSLGEGYHPMRKWFPIRRSHYGKLVININYIYQEALFLRSNQAPFIGEEEF